MSIVTPHQRKDPDFHDGDPEIVFAYALNGKGGVTELSQEDARNGNLTESYWIHLHGDHPNTWEWMEKHSAIDPQAMEALMAAETRPRMTEYDEGAVVILRGVNLNANEEPEDMVSVRVYVDKRRIISVRKRKLKAVHEVRVAYERGQGPKNTGEFIAQLADGLCTHMEPTLNLLNDQIDCAEELVLTKPDARLRNEIVDIRKQAIIFHRYLAPQRDALARMKLSEQKWLHIADKRLLQECYDRMTRYVEDLDAVRDRAQIVHDELVFSLNDKLNKNTFLLSTISAIFLPLTFFTGLLGMNVKGIPIADNPMAFWYFVAFICICTGIQIIFFKISRWW
ncbi:MAG: zinc transporter ZntB [Alphaproteobacteria bacterium]|nr:zinc transporter ZntB [Alphaproteobacteria bacterium]